MSLQDFSIKEKKKREEKEKVLFKILAFFFLSRL